MCNSQKIVKVQIKHHHSGHHDDIMATMAPVMILCNAASVDVSIKLNMSVELTRGMTTQFCSNLYLFALHSIWIDVPPATAVHVITNCINISSKDRLCNCSLQSFVSILNRCMDSYSSMTYYSHQYYCMCFLMFKLNALHVRLVLIIL